jgi:hypothetical protein
MSLDDSTQPGLSKFVLLNQVLQVVCLLKRVFPQVYLLLSKISILSQSYSQEKESE